MPLQRNKPTMIVIGVPLPWRDVSGRGSPIYRTLIVNDSPESQQAIEFMKELGLAFKIEDVTGYDCGDFQLPAVRTAVGKVFHGLDTIKKYWRAFDLVLSEILEERAAQGDPKALRILQRIDQNNSNCASVPA